MKTLKQLLFFFLCMISLEMLAQTAPPKEDSYIEVIGNAEIEVVPDIIYISIVIRERYEGKEKITIEMQEQKLKEALKGIHIDIDNLTLSDAIADYVRVRWGSKDVLTQKEYLLKVSNAVTAGQVFQVLDELTIKGAHIARVDHSKIDSLRKEIRIKAIRSAKEKAEYLLSAINEQAAKPLVIYETPFENPTRRNAELRGARADGTAYYVDGVGVDSRTGNMPEIIEFKKIKIESNIYIRFAIK